MESQWHQILMQNLQGSLGVGVLHLAVHYCSKLYTQIAIVGWRDVDRGQIIENSGKKCKTAGYT